MTIIILIVYHKVLLNVLILYMETFRVGKIFWKKFYAHQDCIYLTKYTVKQ